VLGVTDHTLFKSIYFFDPSGHRLELAFNTGTAEMMKRLDAIPFMRSPRMAASISRPRSQ